MILKRLLGGLLALVLAFAPAYAAGVKPVVIGATTGQQQQIKSTDTLQLPAATTANASINLPHGTAPTSPTNGDCWTTTAGLYCRINGTTVGPLNVGAAISGTPTGGNCASWLNSTTIQDAGAACGGGGGSLTNSIVNVSSNVSISGTSTWTDITGASQSLGAGTWLILANVDASAQGTSGLGVQLYNSTDSAVIDQANVTLISNSFVSGVSISVSSIVTLSGTKTVKLRCAANNSVTWTVSGAGSVFGTTGSATNIMFIKIA
jgi:hypothetical protein